MLNRYRGLRGFLAFASPLPRYAAYTFGVGSKSPTHSQRGDDRYAEEFEGAELPLKYAKPTMSPLLALPEPSGDRKPEVVFWK